MPLLGFGTWRLRGQPAYEAIRAALDVGYRHLDTATMYGNEAEVGRALADSAGPRARCSSPPSCRRARRAGAETLDDQPARAGHRLRGPVAGALAAAARATLTVWREFLALREPGWPAPSG